MPLASVHMCVLSHTQSKVNYSYKKKSTLNFPILINPLTKEARTHAPKDGRDGAGPEVYK